MRQIYIWKPAPFIRLLLPFICGIILQWYLQINLQVILFTITCFLISFLLFNFLPNAFKFKYKALQGLLLNALIFSISMLNTWRNDIKHINNWYGNKLTDSSALIVKINEPLNEKAKTYKADGYVETIINNTTSESCKGKILLYFSKDSITSQLQYGDEILINKNVQQIKNSGNPGAFNYQRYAAFQKTYFTVFLKPNNWIILKSKHINYFNQFIFYAREKILLLIKKYIDVEKDELGIAEALLIGYTNDLDKDLVQAYSNTGVVHIIAISGMHLGLIYIMLVWVFARLPIIKKSKVVQAFLILLSLWVFSLITGGSASVLRSAVMFTFITLGKTIFSKQSSIYNSLAASAFVMLVYNPFFLWDVGFQLSYFAVMGIIIFQKPIFNLWHIKNYWINKIWEMAAVTLAAQIFTFPICIYYFHQFPNLFLITNLIAIPLSTIILFAEIVVVVFSFLPFIDIYFGKITGWLVWLMNKIILIINNLSFSVWDKIPSTILTTYLLYGFTILFSYWLIKKKKQSLFLSLICLLFFTASQCFYKWQHYNQQKLIVYNIPQHQAIDCINGTNYNFIGDSDLLIDGMLQNFHLKPARVLMQLNNKVDSLSNLIYNYPFCQFKNKKILLIDKPINYAPLENRINVDIIIISKNPKLYIGQLNKVFNCTQYVADASNSLWKIDRWKKDCEELHLQLHSTSQNGAFILDL